MDYENEEWGELVNWLHGINSFAQNYNLSSSLLSIKNTQIYIRDNSTLHRKNAVTYCSHFICTKKSVCLIEILVANIRRAYASWCILSSFLDKDVDPPRIYCKSCFDMPDKHVGALVGTASFLGKSCESNAESPNRLIYQSFRIIRLAIFHLFGRFNAY